MPNKTKSQSQQKVIKASKPKQRPNPKGEVLLSVGDNKRAGYKTRTYDEYVFD